MSATQLWRAMRIASAFPSAAAVCIMTLAPGVLCLGASPSLAGTSARPLAVLELFTSQGCSSCPPADRLLGQFARRRDVIAMSLPVGYWDYLGWKDTLAQPAHFDRQLHYAEGSGAQIYTPQLVVNGMVGVVGSDREKIESAIANSLRMIDGSQVSVDLDASGNDLIVRVGAAPTQAQHRSGALWAAWLSQRIVVDVKGGENQGKRLIYHNVVRELNEIASWEGEAGSLRLPGGFARKQGYDLCVVLVQAGDGGPILGAAKLAVAGDEGGERDQTSGSRRRPQEPGAGPVLKP